jgi:hypothetical protein
MKSRCNIHCIGFRTSEWFLRGEENQCLVSWLAVAEVISAYLMRS